MNILDCSDEDYFNFANRMVLLSSLGCFTSMMNRIYLFHQEIFKIKLALLYPSLQTYEPLFLVLNIVRQLHLS